MYTPSNDIIIQNLAHTIDKNIFPTTNPDHEIMRRKTQIRNGKRKPILIASQLKQTNKKR